MARVWESELLAEGDSRKVLVLLALADWANDEGWCWPAIASIAKRARCSEATARRLVQQLQRRGMIAIELNRGRGNTNRYKLNIGVTEVAFSLTSVDLKPSNVCEVLSPENGDRKPCNADTENLANRDEKVSKRGLKPSIAVIPEPSRTVIKNRQENHQEIRRALPDWLLPEVWDNYRAHRHAVRNKHGPWSDRVETIALKKLTELRSQGYDVVEVIEQSILNGWAGFFPVRNGSSNGAGNNQKTVSKADERLQRSLESTRRVAEKLGVYGDDHEAVILRPGAGILGDDFE